MIDRILQGAAEPLTLKGYIKANQGRQGLL